MSCEQAIIAYPCGVPKGVREECVLVHRLVVGSDSYHAEAVIEKDGAFRLLILGADESRIQEVYIHAVKAFVKVVGDVPSGHR